MDLISDVTPIASHGFRPRPAAGRPGAMNRGGLAAQGLVSGIVYWRDSEIGVARAVLALVLSLVSCIACMAPAVQQALQPPGAGKAAG